MVLEQHGGGVALVAGSFALIVVAVCCLGCNQEQVWTPGPEESSTRFLQHEVEQALAALEDARTSLGENPEATGRSLARARRPLLRLHHYYLPLLQAREAAYNALYWHHRGDERRTLEELKVVETVLLEFSDQGDAHLSREFDASLETVVDARAAVRAGRGEASGLLESLATYLNLLLLKGDLALQVTEFDGR